MGARSPRRDAVTRGIALRVLVASLGSLVLAAPATLHAQTPAEHDHSGDAPGSLDHSGHPPHEMNGQGTNKDVARQLNNPVSTIWSLQNQTDFVATKGGPIGSERFAYTSSFQPVLPIHLTKKWNLINRAVMSYVVSNPAIDTGTGNARRKTAFGDTIFANILSPNNAKGLLLGAGPTWIFPTAGSDFTGQEKWSVGPAGVLGYLGKEWIFGVFPQQWFSFAGGGGQSVSQMNVQYFLWRLFPGGWQVGFAPNILFDWKADGDDTVTFPVGLQVGKTFKVGKMPLKIDVGAFYSAVRPDDVPSNRWNIRLRITPVIKPLCCTGTLF